MADTKVSALTAVSSVGGTEEIPVNQGGTSRKATVEQINSYLKSRVGVENASTASALGFASDTYLIGSSCAIPSSSLKAGTKYRVRIHVTKTAAGTVTPIINVRFGTAGTTADTSRGTLTFAAQTAVADEGMIEVFSTFRSVGSGTGGTIHSVGMLDHRLAATGLSTANTSIAVATSAGFDSTVANSILGLSVNGGTAASWSITMVQAELYNLV